MMPDPTDQPWAPLPMKITVTDKGEVLEVGDVQRWIDERKLLLRRARDILAQHDGRAASLYKYHGELIDITRRLAQIKQIFDTFNRERSRHADANIAALVAYFSDPETMAGIDD